MSCKERKKKEVGGNWKLKLDRKQCTGRREARKEEWRNKARQNREKGWQMNVSRTEERKLDKDLAAELAELRKDHAIVWRA